MYHAPVTAESSLRPFLLGSALTARPLLDKCPLPDPIFVEVMAAGSQNFSRLVNAGNARAFAPLSMPAWVQLDCCMLPTAMAGFCAPRATVEDSLFSDLRARVEKSFGAQAADDLARYDGLVPLSEYTSLPSTIADTVVGFSLFALIPHIQLGVRTKALGLACTGAGFQIGMTQYDNSAVRTHAMFGALEILEPRALAHSTPLDTFVYRVALDGERLRALCRGEGKPLPAPSSAFEIPVEKGKTAIRIDEAIAKHGRLAIVGEGLLRDGDRLRLRVAPTADSA
jgi:hypothetical protein